jgi:RNA polymerase sigma-54 factor
MKHSLQLKLSQHLTLTPQLQQSIRLLQLSTLELNQEVDTYLRENPLLEVEEGDEEESGGGAGPLTPFETEAPVKTGDGEMPGNEDYRGEDYQDGAWWEEASTHGGHDEDEESDYSRATADKVTLRQHLHWQLSLSQLSDRDKILVSMLIDALDEDGYLTQPVPELVVLVPPELRQPESTDEDMADELATALKLLQSFDPPGVGARNLAECLTLQLDNLPPSPAHALARKIAASHLETLATRDFNKLKKEFKCSEDELREAHKAIRKLNPRPASDFAVVDTRYIVSDVIVRKVKGLWQASLNPEAMPKLRLNRVYADILARNRDASLQQLSSQLQEAKWLIKNVQQRFDTILRVSQAIVERQRHFFDHGEVAMRPLVLREIAEEVDLHESTVSRVTTQKFMMTPRGVYELKYFFGSHVATEAGGACSATAIRALIKQMIGAEDQKNPLSDSQITDILANQGIMVARRTIAKYRESLQIPAVNLRKSL